MDMWVTIANSSAHLGAQASPALAMASASGSRDPVEQRDWKPSAAAAMKATWDGPAKALALAMTGDKYVVHSEFASSMMSQEAPPAPVMMGTAAGPATKP